MPDRMCRVPSHSPTLVCRGEGVEGRDREGKEEKEDMCVIAIRDGLVNHTLCVNSEINLSVTLIELEAIALMN